MADKDKYGNEENEGPTSGRDLLPEGGFRYEANNDYTRKKTNGIENLICGDSEKKVLGRRYGEKKEGELERGYREGKEGDIEREIERYSDIVCTQIDILSDYDPSKKESLMIRLFSKLKSSMINPNVESMNEFKKIVKDFNKLINEYRAENPDFENNDKGLSKKISELENYLNY